MFGLFFTAPSWGREDRLINTGVAPAAEGKVITSTDRNGNTEVEVQVKHLATNSCRNRHCPKCQAQARQRWLEARERELLAASYFHVVFTVPHELNVLALENPRLFYDLLFTANAQTLLEIAADPKTSSAYETCTREASAAVAA